MALHAIDDIGDAIDATQSFLFPIERGTWLRLAFVMFFIGGGGGLGSFRILNVLTNFAGESGPTGPADPTGPMGSGSEFAVTRALGTLPDIGGLAAQVSGPGSEMPGSAEALVAGFGLILVAAFVFLVFVRLVQGLVSNFVEFVFVQSLVSREVRVRRYFSDHLGDGLQLLAFRVVLDIVTAIVGIVVLGAFFLLALGGETSDLGGSIVAALSLPLVVLVALGLVAVGVVAGFTNVFVVPLMVTRDDSILDGWQRLLGSIRDRPKQYLAYLLLSVVLGIGVGIVGAVLGAVAFVALGIPFFVVGLVVWFALGQGFAAGVLAGIVGVLFLLLLFVVGLLINVPLVAFLRYYAMLVLGDIDETLDPIPTVREDVRS
ncbi:DUF7544 domain-containing protein [Haloarcula nitratireducens]|uniref:AI-2E family transporter n=1 Tax=Haloarcula nitratireducens TaxID=2487749 RepID=A0AAW4PBZ4_9EURY|nr:DUF4013 domain-containing protein [Halomicroarcula nitratireducens]MBX0295419.1 hypothetical protein [Halomicroarcula nitratireducens]